MEFIDHHPVVDHRVRFTDRVEITDTDSEHVKDGQVVVWIVETVCQPPSYHPVEKDSEDRYRFNIQKVRRVAVLTDVLREQAQAYLDDPTQRQGYLGFAAPRYAGDVAELQRMDPEDWLPGPTEPEPANADLPLFDLNDGVEVVGSIYRPGRESETQRLLRETWGDP